jgi:hypothetical protein
VTIPVSARLTAHRKSACWAHRRLDGPTTNLRCQSRGLRSKRTDAARRPIAMVSASTAIAFSLPPTSPQVISARRVRPARWRGPELPGVLRADPAPPDQVCAFTQVTGLGSQRRNSRKSARFDTPTRYMKRASEPRFRRSEALSHTWWQVKDSNLRSFRDGSTDQRWQARDQRQRLSPNKLRAYSQQTADVNRSQPDTIQAARPFPSRRTLYVGSTDGMRGCAH